MGRIALLLGVRGAILASRFLLLFTLASLFPTNEMSEVAGAYVLSSVLIGLGSFELHRDVGRKYVIATEEDRADLLRDHLVLLSCFALVAGVLVWPLSWIGLLLPTNVAAVATIVTLQILNADVTRFFFLRRAPLVANIHMLVATSSWILVFAPLVYSDPDLRTAQFAFACWIGSSVCGLLFLPWLGVRNRWRNVLAGPRHPALSARFLVAIVPFAATTLMLLSNSIDRLVLRVIGPPNTLNTVFFLVGIMQVISIVVDVVVNQRVYPRLVRLRRNRNACRRSSWLVARTSIVVGLGTAPVLGALAFLLAQHHASIAPGNHVLFIALLGIGFVLDAVVAQLVNASYAFGFDKLVLKGSFADFVVTGVLAVVLLTQFGALGACLLWVARGVTRLTWYGIVLALRLREGRDRSSPFMIGTAA